MKTPAARIGFTLGIAMAATILPFVIVGEMPGERWLHAHDDNAFRFGLTGGALLALDFALPIPSSIVGSLLGARLGLGWGLAWAFAGLLVGNVAGFVVGRLTLARLAGELPRAPAVIAVLLSRPVPILAETLSFTAGAGRMAIGAFLVAAGAGDFVYAGVLAANGAALLPDGWTGPGVIVPLALPVVGWGIWRMWTRKRARSTS